MSNVLVDLCDCAFGTALALMRALLILGESRAVRRCARMAALALRVAVLLALLVCAGLVASWLWSGHAPGR